MSKKTTTATTRDFNDKGDVIREQTITITEEVGPPPSWPNVKPMYPWVEPLRPGYFTVRGVPTVNRQVAAIERNPIGVLR